MEGDKKTKDKKKSIRINMKELLEATELTVVP